MPSSLFAAGDHDRRGSIAGEVLPASDPSQSRNASKADPLSANSPTAKRFSAISLSRPTRSLRTKSSPVNTVQMRRKSPSGLLYPVETWSEEAWEQAFESLSTIEQTWHEDPIFAEDMSASQFCCHPWVLLARHQMEGCRAPKMRASVDPRVVGLEFFLIIPGARRVERPGAAEPHAHARQAGSLGLHQDENGRRPPQGPERYRQDDHGRDRSLLGP
jgi:hypothetical protein